MAKNLWKLLTTVLKFLDCKPSKCTIWIASQNKNLVVDSKTASKSQLYHYNSTLDCLAELQLCQQPCRSPFYGMLSPLITLSPFVALPFPGILILVPKLCCNRGCVQCSVHSAKPFLPRLYYYVCTSYQ